METTSGRPAAATAAECKHCGQPFQSRGSEDDFCCAGCEYVFRLIRDQGLERFYQLQDGKGQPVGSGVFSRRNYRWLEEGIRLAEQGDRGSASLEVSLGGVSCVGCVWLIETLYRKAPGAMGCRIDAQRGIMRMEWVVGRFDGPGFARLLQSYGYALSPLRRERDRTVSSIVWRLGVCGAFALNSMLYTFPSYLGMGDDFAFAIHFEWLSFLFATLSMVFGGSYFGVRALKAARNGVIHLDLPITIGLVFAYGISIFGWATGDADLLYFDFVSTFVFLMLAGRWAQLAAVEKNRSRLAEMEVGPPRVEIVQEDGSLLEKGAESLRPGDAYRVVSGEWIPVESVLRNEKVQLGMEWINGEAQPRTYLQGAIVPSGGRQLGKESLELEAREPWSSSLLRRLTERKEERSDTDRVIHLWISRYLMVVMLLAVAGFVAWGMLGESRTGIRAFVSTLVISCPCALGIALPLADELLIAALRRRSVFLRSHAFWSRFSKVDSVAFDKTGTLTRLNLTLMNPEVLERLDGESLRALSSLVAESSHPVGATLREQLMASGRWAPNPDLALEEIVGSGVEGVEGETAWRLGKCEWALSETGDARTCLAKDGCAMAYFEFEDAPRKGVYEVTRSLRSWGLHLYILSGDAIERVRRLGGMLSWDADAVFGAMTPEGKAAWLRERSPNRFLMIGDGANDSLAFEAAACAGAPAVDQSLLSSRADFYYLGDGISGAMALFEARDARRRAFIRLLSFAIGYNAFGCVLALSGWVTPLWAAILMPASSVVSLAIVWMMLGGDKALGTRGGRIATRADRASYGGGT